MRNANEIIIGSKALTDILARHQHWIERDVNEWEKMRADLRGADLRRADLRDVDLYSANLYGADLCSADLCGADLCGTNLRNANLCGTNLRNANLCDANLRNANLCGANLCNANLCGADLCGTNLRNANLCGTNLRNADLCGADLYGADLYGADLRSVNLCDAKNVPYIPMICPEEGAFVGWKKASEKIVQLLIPEDAKRSSAATRKCRCNKAVVMAIYEIDGKLSEVTSVQSNFYSSFVYSVGETVEVCDFDEERWNECSTGIHFFMQRQEAINY